MRWVLRVVALLAFSNGLALMVPPKSRLAAVWTPLSLAAGPAGEVAPGLYREPGAVVDPRLDTVETPLVTHNARPMDVRWSGSVRVPRAGNWALGLYTDAPATLSLGAYRVLRHPGGGPRLIARSLVLGAGVFPLTVECRAGPGALRATLVWQPPGEPLAVVPAAALGHGGTPAARRIQEPPLAHGALALPLTHPLELSNPVLFRWDHTRFGTPSFPPLYFLKLTGRTGSGSAVAEEILSDGDEEAALARLAAAGPLTADVPVPRRALALLALAALLGLASARGGWERPDARGWRTIAVTACCGLALWLRLDHFTLVPRPLETEDELIHHWNGYSLLAGTGSLGWSDLPAYGARDATFWWGRRLHLAQPFLDWPPPLCALTGLVDRWAGAHHPFDLPLDRTRAIPILCGVLATWFAYRLARQVHGGTAAPLIACALMATLPPAVAASRLVKADGLLAALAAGLCWAALRHRASGSARSLAWTLLLAFAAVAVKQSGAAFALAAVLALASARRGAAFAVLAALVAGLATYPAWGCLWDKTLYYQVQAQVGQQAFKPEHVLALMTDGGWVDRPFGGGWMLFLWLAFLAPAPRGGLLKLALVGYATLVALTTWYPFGWYRLPLYPFLAVLAAAPLAALLERPRLPVAFAAVALCVWPALAYRLPLDGATARPVVGALTAALLVVPAWCHAGGTVPRWLARASGGALVALVIGLGAVVVRHLPYLEQGIAKERQAAYEPLASEGGAKRTVRWR